MKPRRSGDEQDAAEEPWTDSPNSQPFRGLSVDIEAFRRLLLLGFQRAQDGSEFRQLASEFFQESDLAVLEGRDERREFAVVVIRHPVRELRLFSNSHFPKDPGR